MTAWLVIGKWWSLILGGLCWQGLTHDIVSDLNMIVLKCKQRVTMTKVKVVHLSFPWISKICRHAFNIGL